ncbi:MAG: 3-deoxy-D-manno-octulosonic acid transferase [Planctomycetia bacterium]|nr:3-deoxy-D-manno-octulosonic acid transferase [Planctomycetia bacterium]
MRRVFFNFAYILLLILFLPYLFWTLLFRGKYRKGFGEKFCGNVPLCPRSELETVLKIEQNMEQETERKRVWIHAVSVGEVNLAATILREFERLYPDFDFVISSTSRTGLELARKKFPGRTVFYAPLDFSWAVKRAFARIQPDFLVLVELEIWPNLILTAKKLNVPVIVMNGRLGEKSFRNYSRLKCIFRPILRTLALVTAQDEASAERFRVLGVPADRVENVGSIKYDGAQSDRNNEKTCRLAALWKVLPTDKIFLAGSTQDPEESMAVEVFRRLSPTHPELRLIIVPRHAERFAEVAKMLEKTEFPFQKRSKMGKNVIETTLKTTSETVPESVPGKQSENARCPILLVDTIGELGGWWGTSAVGFVGGSMGSRGGQNMLEPAAFGTAVSFGPNTWNFRDIVQKLLAHDAAVVVHNTEELTDFVRRCLEDADFSEKLGQRAADFVASQQGALRKTFDCFAMKIKRK